jgi:hypothetical protein
MAEPDAGPWPIPLQRSVPRLLLLVATRTAIGTWGILTALSTFGVVATVLNLASGLVIAYSVSFAAYLFSLSLEAAPGELRVRSLFWTGRYRLRKGEVRRAWVGRARGRLETRVGGLGVHVGHGQLGGESLVDVIALDRTASLVMVPVEGGRFAIAPASEVQLIDALAIATARRAAGRMGAEEPQGK